jgi:hypothetical protein
LEIFEGLGFKEEEAFFRKVEEDELREKTGDFREKREKNDKCAFIMLNL